MSLPKLNPRKLVNVLFDEYHSESWSVSRERAREMQPKRPENSSYEQAADTLAAREFIIARNTDRRIDADLLENVDVLVLIHPCDPQIEHTTSNNSPQLSEHEMATLREFVSRGGGLFVITEYENRKYGNNLRELCLGFGITIEDYSTVRDDVSAINEEKTHVLADIPVDAEDLLIGVQKACFYRTGSCEVRSPARVLLAASSNASPPQAALIAIAEVGKGRVVVVNDSDIFGDEHFRKFDHRQLWLNLWYWIAETVFSRPKRIVLSGDSGKPLHAWLHLKDCVNELRTLHHQSRLPDNSYSSTTSDSARVAVLVSTIIDCISSLKAQFPHDGEYLDQVIADFREWERGGFARPNFIRSLALFNPQACRQLDIEHLAIFPLYTPNNSLDIYFEALVIRVPWYDWLEAMERHEFRNDKFVPGHLVDFTKGYDSECAVLFPETVSVDGEASNNFGVIFCDREARRYQKVVSACSAIVHLNSPPELTCFLRSLDLVTDMFAAWDLVHDTSHAKGPLPFDPFMIRQLAPYWMYALEELRVDLRSVKAGMRLAGGVFPFGKTIAYGVLFDRIFRFAITGGRDKNYDGLAGQFLFAALHKKRALAWEDNQLTVHWDKVFDAMIELSDEVEALYDDSADYSRVRRFIAGHQFMRKYLQPAVHSRWVDFASLPIAEEDAKGWIAAALQDEFPLGSFHTQLKKKYAVSSKTTTPSESNAQIFRTVEIKERHYIEIHDMAKNDGVSTDDLVEQALVEFITSRFREKHSRLPGT